MGIFRKADPMGSDIPTKVPRPRAPGGGGGGSEPVPRPGLPPQYPRYLKPIPVNDRNVEQVIRDQIAKQEPELVRWLYSTWNANAEALKYQEIRNAVRDQEVPEGWIRKWREDYIRVINERFDPQWRRGMVAGAKNVSPGLARVMADAPQFDEHADRIRGWIQARGADLAVGFTDDQATAVRNVIRHMVGERGAGPDQLAQVLRPIIGLTPGQTAAVMRFRQALDDEGGLTREQIVNRVQNYSAMLHRQRAERIARTEIAFAFNFGSLEQIRQAKDSGDLDDPVIKEFWTAVDERVCPFCGPLHQTVVDLEETFPGATDKVPNTQTPPVHPLCRCTIVYRVLKAQAPPGVPVVPPGQEVPAGTAPPSGFVPVTSIQEAEERIRKGWPHITPDFTGYHIDVMNVHLEEMEKLFTDYPDVAARLKYIGTLQGWSDPAKRHPSVTSLPDPRRSQDSSIRAIATMNSGINGVAISTGEWLLLNAASTHSPAAADATVARKGISGWSPVPKDRSPWLGTLIHEFGHLVDFQLGGWMPVKGVSDKLITTSGVAWNKGRDVGPFKQWEVKMGTVRGTLLNLKRQAVKASRAFQVDPNSPSGLNYVSGYASHAARGKGRQADPEGAEAFAEGFVMARTWPKGEQPDWVRRQAKFLEMVKDTSKLKDVTTHGVDFHKLPEGPEKEAARWDMKLLEALVKHGGTWDEGQDEPPDGSVKPGKGSSTRRRRSP